MSNFRPFADDETFSREEIMQLKGKFGRVYIEDEIPQVGDLKNAEQWYNFALWLKVQIWLKELADRSTGGGRRTRRSRRARRSKRRT
jgi:hypothetical protein